MKSQKKILLPVLAVIVVFAAAAALLLPRLWSNEEASVTAVSGGDLLIQTEDIGTEASYFDYDVDGVTVEVLAVLASDGTIRLALNTCQVCNGSPYAYFVQDGDDFVCQNCLNRFSSTDVGVVSGGCNPVPITAEDYTESDGTFVVPAFFLEENASRFVNWKQF